VCFLATFQMKTRCSIIPVSLLFVQLLQAQIDFRPGYIIQNNGDTVYGEIDFRSELLRGQSCYFRDPVKFMARDYSPNNLLGYRFIDGKYYISREINGKKVFLEFLIQGKISIYYLRDTSGEHYYLEKEGYEFTELPYEDKILYKDVSNNMYKSYSHIALLNLYMQDAPAMKEKINGLGKPTHKNLIRLAKNYHEIVTRGDPCMVFEK
jgi:hypothetical protein